jgi:hypothetical protein
MWNTVYRHHPAAGTPRTANSRNAEWRSGETDTLFASVHAWLKRVQVLEQPTR